MASVEKTLKDIEEIEEKQSQRILEAQEELKTYQELERTSGSSQADHIRNLQEKMRDAEAHVKGAREAKRLIARGYDVGVTYVAQFVRGEQRGERESLRRSEERREAIERGEPIPQTTQQALQQAKQEAVREKVQLATKRGQKVSGEPSKPITFEREGKEYEYREGRLYQVQEIKEEPSKIVEGREVIVGYDVFGRPLKQSVAESELTERQKARADLELSITDVEYQKRKEDSFFPQITKLTTLPVQQTAQLVEKSVLLTERLEGIARPISKSILTEARIEKVSRFAGKVGGVVGTGLFAQKLIPLVPQVKERSEFIARGVVKGQLIDIREQPVKQAVLIGAGVGVGAVSRTARIGVGSIGARIGGVRGTILAQRVFTVTEVGLATALTAPKAIEIIKTQDAQERVEKAGVFIKDIGLIGIGAGIGSKIPIFKRTYRFQQGTIQQFKQLQQLKAKGIIDKPTAEALEVGINLQRTLRKAPDVPITKSIKELTPKGLSQKQKIVFERVLKEDVQLFGSKSLEARGITKGKDIDIATRENKILLRKTESALRKVSKKGEVMRRGEAIGVGKEKAIDIKALERLEAYPLKEKPIITKEGLKVIKVSEQFSRGLSGTLELRKGGKDIKSVILSGRALVKQISIKAETTKIPVLKPIRQFQARRTEVQLIKLEKAIPKITSIIVRVGEAEVPKFPKRFGLITQDVEIFPTDKKARVSLTKMKGREGAIVKKEADVFKKIPEAKKIKAPPSKLKPSKITPSITSPSRITPSTERTPLFKFEGIRIPKYERGTYGVQVRRGGKFIPIARGLSLQKAISVGQQRVGRTLAATFKLVPQARGKQIGSIRTPKGFYQKKGLIFIEKPKYRLSTGTEVQEIKIARRSKKKSKKKRGKKR